MKSVLWRVAKRLSYIEDARRFKIKPIRKYETSTITLLLIETCLSMNIVEILTYANILCDGTTQTAVI